ncbi:PhoH family protein [Geobacillus thermodenitrificans]|uniref:PhoH family protein n=1 Tax=Geobacillus thermodenitrificans TaxID=33940 RepID=UPI003D25238F
MGKILVDTNVLMNNPDVLDNSDYVISGFVIRELEKLKQSENNDRSYKARLAIRKIEENADKLEFVLKEPKNEFDDYDDDYIDNRILTLCKQQGFSLLTGDLLLKMKARAVGVDVIEVDEDEDEYKGYVEVYMTDEEYTDFYQNRLDLNEFDLLVNQYLIIKDSLTGDVLDALRFDGQYYVAVKNKGFKTNLFGSFKPYDYYQACALDSLQNNQMTMIKGKPGSGKSLIALNYAIQQIERGKYSKLICFVNPVASRNSAKLGYYPGTRDEKILDSAVGSMLASKFGDKYQVESMIANNQLLLLPFSDIRGFDTTGMNAICWIIESQNLDIDLMKLAIQRIGDDSKLIIDGDYNSQVDHSSYEGSNNGMRRVSQVFRGKEMYGEIELPIIYRSKIAAIADEM